MKSKYVLKEVETHETAVDYMEEQLSVGDKVVISRQYSRGTPYMEHGIITKIIICRNPETIEIEDTRLEIKRIGSSISYRNKSEGETIQFSYGKRKITHVLNILKI